MSSLAQNKMECRNIQCQEKSLFQWRNIVAFSLTHQPGLPPQYLCKWRNYELDPTDWSSYEDLAKTTALDAWEKEHPPPQGAGKPPPPLQPAPAPKKGDACLLLLCSCRCSFFRHPALSPAVAQRCCGFEGDAKWQTSRLPPMCVCGVSPYRCSRLRGSVHTGQVVIGCSAWIGVQSGELTSIAYAGSAKRKRKL